MKSLMMMLWMFSLALMTSCSERQPASYQSRLHDAAVSFCVKLNNCTTAKYDVCMKSIENRVPSLDEDSEMELEKLKQFTQTSTCNDIWLMLYSYSGGK